MRYALIVYSIIVWAVSTWAAPVKVPSPVSINMAIVAELTANYDEGKYQVDKKEFLAKIGPHLQADLLVKMTEYFKDVETIDVTSIKTPDFEIHYNEETLVIEVKVSADGKGMNVLSFNGMAAYAGTSSVKRPSLLSGYLNFRGSKIFVHKSPFDDTFDRPFAGNIEGVLNLGGVVFESNVDYVENGTPPWRRGDVRLIWDDEDNAVRYSMGDINYPVSGFQSFRSMGGLSVARNFSIQPYRVVTPSGHNQFFLKTRSQVKIYVNGRFFREVELAEGLHNIRNLPVVRGINEIELEITDAFGQREVIRFPVLSEGELLADGIHQFAYNVGAPSSREGSGKEYDENLVTTSLFHRYGLTDQFTLGASYQGDRRQNLVGGEVVTGLPLGFLGLESAYSWTEQDATGWAYRGRYFYLGNEQDRWVSQDFGFQVEYFDRDFTSLQALTPSNPFKLNIDANMGQPISENWRVSFSYRYQFARDVESDNRIFSTLLSYGGFRFRRLSAEYSHSDSIEGVDEDRFFLTWTWTGETLGNYLVTTYNSDGSALRSEYQYTKNIRNAQLGASVSGTNSEDGRSFGVVGEYVGQRMFTVVDHEEVFPQDDELVHSSQTRVDFGTALAFTTGSVAMSRPITDSFTLIKADESLDEFELGVNPAGSYSLAEIGLFDTAILSNQASYIYETVRIDTRDLPYGVTISGGENFVVKPTYRSGVHIDLGGSSVVYMRGRLLNIYGEPLALVSGEIRQIEDPSLATSKKKAVDSATPGLSQTFFTNRQGFFSVEGLNSGHFQIILYDLPDVTAEFLIPKKTRGAFSVGDIHIWEKDNE